MSATVLTNATLIDQVVTTVLIEDGSITAVGDDVAVPDGADVEDLTGYLLLPAAVEPHAHLDKAFLAELVRNPTGDLLGAIEAMQANRHLMDGAGIVERAERAARLMAANGYAAIRTHADVTVEHGLRSVEALAEVRRKVADVIDIEIVVLAGWPICGAQGADTRALVRESLSMGADLVGGCPHLEVLMGGDIESATDLLLQIATDHGVGVDLHTDETLDPSADGLDVLARRVLDGFALPASASHCVSLGVQTEVQQRDTAERVAAAGVHVIALPHTNLFLQGRGHVPMPRGLTAIAALRAATTCRTRSTRSGGPARSRPQD
jgi:cytosine/creatinine deaminase